MTDKILKLLKDFGAPGLGVSADVVTVVLGALALWGFIFKRKQISLALRVIANTYLNQRVNRLKEALGRLDSLSYDNKEDRSEIQALVGQVCGQIKPLLEDYPRLADAYNSLTEFVDGKKRLSESKKRRIVYEIHGVLDSVSFAQNTRVFEKNDG